MKASKRARNIKADAKKKQASKDNLQNDDKDFVGKRIAKKFHGDVYSGTVAKFLHDDQFWVVDYDDGDTEEMDINDIGKGIDLHKKLMTASRELLRSSRRK